jgi:enoyl-CoA hydratase/carnithine racemase
LPPPESSLNQTGSIMTQHIEITRSGAVQIIRLNRPDKKNAITRAMYDAMREGLLAAEVDDAIRCHVFLGVPGAFSAGNDMQDFLAYATTGGEMPEVINFLETLANLKKPVVSGVDGLAIGIGMTLHLHCDLTLATSRSLFRTPFVDLGLVPEAASSLLVPAIVGHQKAFALLGLGDGISGEEALAGGLIYKIVSEETLEADTIALAQTVASRAPEALQIARRLMKAKPETVVARIHEEAKLFSERLRSAEARDAFMAFMSRKK